ncbi:HSP20-like chaperone [Mycena olivaceomarginata]|nr:HSP20-like chaperone [Mycena olivaceomarginata]
MTLLHPELLWAQRSSESDETMNVVYLTVNLPDIQVNTMNYSLEPTKIFFKATSGNATTGYVKDYTFSLNLFAEVIPEKSSKALTERSLSLVLHKKERQIEYWPRLTREKDKNGQIKTDFSKWVDSEDQTLDAQDDDDFEFWSMPPSSRIASPGMGGMDFAKMMAEMSGGGCSSLFGSGSSQGAPAGFSPTLKPKSTAGSSSKIKTRDGDEEVNPFLRGNEGATEIAKEDKPAAKKRKRTDDAEE